MQNPLRRYALNYLQNNWVQNPERKPLIIQGARHVGKTTLVEIFAHAQERELITVNFETDPSLKDLFAPNSPLEIHANLEAHFGHTLSPDSTLLFLDEIQEAPNCLAKIHWFYEKIPSLPVIAAQSFCETPACEHAHNKHDAPLEHLHLEPLSFSEFLYALREDHLVNFLIRVKPPFNIPEEIHEPLQKLFREYLFVGGMPKAVHQWAAKKSTVTVSQIQRELLTNARKELFRYKGRYDVHHLDSLFCAIPDQLGSKFSPAKTTTTIQSAAARKILSIFTKAQIVHPVSCSSGNALTLSKDINHKFNQYIFLDIGLANHIMETPPLLSTAPINAKLAEQVVGQTLRTLFHPLSKPELFCWRRNKKGSNARISYLAPHKSLIVPIIVKEGSIGRLKSLHQFMHEKQLSLAVRINDEQPCITHVNTINHEGTPVSYTLLSIPFYLTEWIPALIDGLGSQNEQPTH